MIDVTEVEKEVIIALKNIVNDLILKVDKKSRTIEFADRSVFYILKEGEKGDFFYKTEHGYACFTMSELLGELTGLSVAVFEKLEGFNEEIGILIEATIGYENYIEMIKNITDGGKLILLIEEDKVKLSNGYFAFRLE